jgi:hypothetical protein
VGNEDDRAGCAGYGHCPWRPLPGPLSVRNRRPGDRFTPVGLDGQKKLQDFFRGP